MHLGSALELTILIKLHKVMLHNHFDSTVQSPMCKRQEGFGQCRNMKYSTDHQILDLNTLDKRFEDYRAHASRVYDVAISQLYWDNIGFVVSEPMSVRGHV